MPGGHSTDEGGAFAGLDLGALLGDGGLRDVLRELEAAVIAYVPRRHRGNVSGSARRLGMHRHTLTRKIDRHGLARHASRQRGRPTED